MPGRLIAIGDIHGCAAALRTLIEAIQPTPEDTIVPLGDYIDRGSDSRSVIQQLIELSGHCKLVPLFGNHEELFFAARESEEKMPHWLYNGGVATIASYADEGGLEGIPDDHIAFLKNCRNYFETENHFFVHANYVPNLPLAEQPLETLRWLRLDQKTPERHQSGKTAFVGHTPQGSHEVLDLGHLKCIDTYCFGGGRLTAYEVNTGKVWQASEQGKLRG